MGATVAQTTADFNPASALGGAKVMKCSAVEDELNSHWRLFEAFRLFAGNFLARLRGKCRQNFLLSA
jgi:hypothetical protein